MIGAEKALERSPAGHPNGVLRFHILRDLDGCWGDEALKTAIFRELTEPDLTPLEYAALLDALLEAAFALEAPSDQQVVRIDGAVAALGAACFVACPLDAEASTLEYDVQIATGCAAVRLVGLLPVAVLVDAAEAPRDSGDETWRGVA